MNNLRMPKRGEILPDPQKGENTPEFIARYNGGFITLFGNIGKGNKIHKLDAAYISLNGDLVIRYAHTICGSESYKSMSSINLDATTCNCLKCLKIK
jgi:hypothetical protein